MPGKASPRSETESAKSWGRELLESLGLAFCFYLIVANYAVAAYEIPSGSMLPSLQIGDRLLVSRVSYDLNLLPASLRLGLLEIPLPGGSTPLWRLDDPQRGDIVVFHLPELNPEPLIKRVVGLPGETVELRGQRVFINGQALADPWGQLTPGPLGGCAGADFGPVKVPAGQYFMLGDNRCNSYDSRLWAGHGGFVPRRRILGRASLIFWPGHQDQPGDRWSRLGPPMQ